MVVSNANTLDASAAWVAKLGRLAPREVTDTNTFVRAAGRSPKGEGLTLP
jgi:hypothetical protein